MTVLPVPQALESLPPSSGASEAICVINSEGIIRFATPTVAQLYGYSLEDILGRSTLRFVAAENRDYVLARWQGFLADTARVFDQIIVSAQAGSGQRFPIRVSIWRLPEPDQFLLVHHVFDQIQNRLQALYAIQSIVSGTLELESVLDTVLREVNRLIPCNTCTIFVRERDNTIRARRWQEGRIDNYRAVVHENLPEFETSRVIRETQRPLIIDDTQTDPRWVNLPNHRPIRSWLGAPLIHRGEFMGELNLDSPEPHTFSPEDAELAYNLAIHIASALHNARQYEDKQRRAERFRAVSEVSQAISQLELRSVLDLVYRNVSRLMDTTTFFIGLYDQEAEIVRLVGSYDHGVPRSDEVQSAQEGITGLVIRTCQPLIILDDQRDPLPEEIIIDGEVPRSLLMMPLITKDDIVGVISVQSYEPNSYTQDDIEVLSVIADAVATAVRNAQLYDQALEQMHALEALHQMSLDLAAVQDPDIVAVLVTRAALTLFQPDEARLYLCPDPLWKAKTWIMHLGDTLPQFQTPSEEGNPTGSLSDEICRVSEPVVVSNLAEDPTWPSEFDTPWPVQAGMIFPVIRGEHHLATLSLLYREAHFFRRETLRTMELLCHQAATALENARSTVTLRRRLEEVTALHGLAREISSMESLGEILQTVVNTMHEVYECKSSSIQLVDPAREQLITLAAAGLEPQYVEQARFAMGEYVAGQVAQTGKVIYVPDTHADPNFRAVDPAVRSLLVVPLTVRGRVVGTMGIDGTVPNAFTADHERVLTIAGGQIAATIETVRLIQETRAHATQLAEANTQLAAQDELRRELVYQVSHDLRGPLQIVYGYADMMRDEMLGPVTQTQKEILSLILKRSKAIERLTKDIMAARPISREALELSVVNLSELCQQSLVDAQMVCSDSRFRFESELMPEDLFVEGDYNRLSRVFDNLFHNAIKFSPNGGTITLRTRRNQERHCAQVSITDQGIGITADKLPYIFERFYRGDKAFRQRFEGTGLGLYNVQQIIEAHHGTVWVESQEGAGSTFFFELPLIDPS